METLTVVQAGHGHTVVRLRIPPGWDEVRVFNCVVERRGVDDRSGRTAALTSADDDDVTTETTGAPGVGNWEWELRVDDVVVDAYDLDLIDSAGPGRCRPDRVEAVFYNFSHLDLDLAMRVTFRCSNPPQPTSIYLFPPPRWVTRLQVWFGSLFWRSP